MLLLKYNCLGVLGNFFYFGMGRIIQLSKNVINQIAAGEVIERPFSVVKELVENSIDAGATRISVEISNECRNMRIADNGSGIHPDDVVLAFSKHATSKIETGEDLYAVKTMGFRGEALASIISISKLTCITRTKDYDTGVKIECENSEVKQAKTGCAVGTVMEIRDLFYNIPARLKFLKSAKTEFAYISELLQSLALAHPKISFDLKNNGKTILKTTGQNDLLITISEIFSDDIAKNIVPVEKSDKISSIRISGYISTPNFTRASKKDYYMFVNSRIVKCPIFQKSIDTAYKNLTGNSGYPFIILNLELPPEDIDVNVHPSKKEVKYKNPNQIFNFIYSSIDSSLTKTTANNHLAKIADTNKIEKTEVTNKDDSIFIEEDQTIDNIFKKEDKPSLTLISSFPDKESSRNIENTSIEKNVIKHAFDKQISYNNSPKQEKLIVQHEQDKEDIIIGQYKKTYILIEREEGLEIVDQHIAEERYIYEQLKKSKNIDCQLLFISDVIEISHTDKELLETNKDKLNKFGYEIDFISDNEVIFRKVPHMLAKISPKEILTDILEHISGDIDNIEEQILITTSCKASVKANTYLNHFQMEEIIRNWRTCEKPYTCPHGRPISKIIEHKDLAKFFQRNK